MQRLRRIALIAGALLALSSTAAHAWGTLTVTDDGVRRGRALGAFHKNTASTHAVNYGYYVDDSPNSNGVYVAGDFLYYIRLGLDEVPEWNWVASFRWPNTSHGAGWRYGYSQKALRSDSDKARGTDRVCEDKRFWFDPCSAQAITTFSY